MVKLHSFPTQRWVASGRGECQWDSAATRQRVAEGRVAMAPLLEAKDVSFQYPDDKKPTVEGQARHAARLH